MEKVKNTLNIDEIRSILMIVDEYAELMQERNNDLCPDYMDPDLFETSIVKLFRELRRSECRIDWDYDFPKLKEYRFLQSVLEP
ncbi:MAG: hypothetical protein GY863_19500, partial [bacterium]|nr:hypothetical protein [bacterium]